MRSKGSFPLTSRVLRSAVSMRKPASEPHLEQRRRTMIAPARFHFTRGAMKRVAEGGPIAESSVRAGLHGPPRGLPPSVGGPQALDPALVACPFRHWRAGTLLPRPPETRARLDPPLSSTPRPSKRRSFAVRLLPSGPD